MNNIEIQFYLRGRTLPADHGYAQYAAIKKLVLDCQNEELKQSVLVGDKDLSPEMLLCTVPGVPNRKGMIYLNRSSRLRLRCPNAQRQAWYRLLQNQVLDIQGHLVRLTQPRLALITPQEKLSARLVTFKLDKWDHHEAPVHFLKSAQKALTKLEIQGEPYIESDRDGDLALRAVRVKGKHILGFGVGIEGLSESDSLKLQANGLGGRKHFGCGWFFAPGEEQDAA
ncbi:MAG: type I-MYXAN CRISPR-associated protein Cas6/Cmx6 [Cyanobacteria bacterium P01_G01_bin.54]